jgi:hypothetical protein
MNNAATFKPIKLRNREVPCAVMPTEHFLRLATVVISWPFCRRRRAFTVLKNRLLSELRSELIASSGFNH